MDNNNEYTPLTSGSQTPSVTSGSPTPPGPAGGGWGQMGGYYNMYPPWWQGMPGGQPGWQGMPGGQPGWQGMPGMPGWQTGWQGMPGGQPGWQPGMPGGDNVYRPTIDFMTAASHTSTPAETQFTGCDTFSFEELGIDLDDTPIQTGGRGRGQGRGQGRGGGRGGDASKKKKSKGKTVVGESSQAGAGDEDDDEVTRRKWTEDEMVALSKAWLRVCDDPLNSNNQRIYNLWNKIRDAYQEFCPHGRPHDREKCRREWDRIRGAVSRFAGLYINAERDRTSGQTDDDVRRAAEIAFPLKGVYKEFVYWGCYQVLWDSEKFRAGCAAGWPKKQRLNQAGDYSSSGGSHAVPDDDTPQEFPTPSAFTRRTRPVGQKRAIRGARGASQWSPEVQSAPTVAPELSGLARHQKQMSMWKMIKEWRAATDPVEKGLLYDLMQSMRADLGIAPSGAGDAGDSGAGDSGAGDSGAGDSEVPGTDDDGGDEE